MLLGPNLIINLAQLVSPSVALPAELVFVFISHEEGTKLIRKKLEICLGGFLFVYMLNRACHKSKFP